MSHDKNRYDKAYDEGYKEGKEDNTLGTFSHNLTKGMSLGDQKKTDSHDAGYSDGAADRGGGSDNYHGGGGGSSSNCFITTATLEAIGKPDNCEELNIFRNFRDNWLAKQSDGQVLITEYYKIAPPIVTLINSVPDKKRIYMELWRKSIEPCLNLIKQNRFAEAKTIYCNVVIELKQRFFPIEVL